MKINKRLLINSIILGILLGIIGAVSYDVINQMGNQFTIGTYMNMTPKAAEDLEKIYRWFI